MPVSSRLPYSLFNQSGQTPVPGLRYAEISLKEQKLASKNASYERALAVAVRVLQASNLRDIPLPSGLRTIAPQTLVTAPVDVVNSILEGQERPLASGSERSISANAVTGPGRLALLLSTRSIDPTTADVLKALSKAPKSEPSLADTAKKSTASQRAVKPFSAINRTKSSPSASVPDPAVGSDKKYYNSLLSSPEASPLPRGIDRPIPPYLTALTSVTEPGPSASLGSFTGSGLLPKMFWPDKDETSEPGPQKRASKGAETATGSAALSTLKLPKHASTESLDRVGLAASWFNSPVSTQMTTASAVLSKQREDLQQQSVPPVSPGRSVRRGGGNTRYQANGTGASTASAAVADGGRGETGLNTQAQNVNVAGAVILDGRRLGRLTASSQAREASLPARGPSRVNLRAVPIYSGMQIPS